MLCFFLSFLKWNESQFRKPFKRNKVFFYITSLFQFILKRIASCLIFEVKETKKNHDSHYKRSLKPAQRPLPIQVPIFSPKKEQRCERKQLLKACSFFAKGCQCNFRHDTMEPHSSPFHILTLWKLWKGWSMKRNSLLSSCSLSTLCFIKQSLVHKRSAP